MQPLSLQQARELLWDAFAPGPEVELPLALALGKVLARDLATDMDFPPFARMAMDGYAVRAADTAGASPSDPRRLRVIGLAAAGAPLATPVGSGEAARAMTGAPLPPGADAVVPVERTGGYHDTWAEIHGEVRPGAHVAPQAQDLRTGDIVLQRGTVLSSRHVQALASAGWIQVPVIEPPRTAVLSTGDELVPADQRPGPGQIRESNNPCVQALLREFGLEVHDLGAAVDEPKRLRESLQRALSEYELLILSGGVSKGEKDFVKPALMDLGVQLHFESLDLKPGRPATFGTHPGGAVFALPGNPVAVFVTLLGVFSAGLRRRLGYRSPESPAAYGRLGFEAVRKGTRPQLLPVRLEAPPQPDLPVVLPTDHHGSGDFISLARADALALLPASADRFAAGEIVRIVRLCGNGESP